MIYNITQKNEEYFNDKNIKSFKRELVNTILSKLWDRNLLDYVELCQQLADLALESEMKAALIDVPSFATSMLETELMVRGIRPIHYFSDRLIEINVELILENIYIILSNETAPETNKEIDDIEINTNPMQNNLTDEYDYPEMEDLFVIEDEFYETVEEDTPILPALIDKQELISSLSSNNHTPFKVKIKRNF